MAVETPSAQSSKSFVDPQTLMRIRNLELRARVVVQGFWNGMHRSPYHGFSVEFTEYRQYTPGDDPRYLDWRVYARSDRYFIKKFEDETNLRCHLLVDSSRSMTYGSKGYTKSDYARTFASQRPITASNATCTPFICHPPLPTGSCLPARPHLPRRPLGFHVSFSCVSLGRHLSRTSWLGSDGSRHPSA